MASLIEQQRYSTETDEEEDDESASDVGSFLSLFTDHNPDISHSMVADPNKKISQATFTKTEDTGVRCLRRVTLLVLLLAALGISVSVFLYLDRSEQGAFVDQFESDAAKVIKEIGSTLDNTMGPADALIRNLVAFNTYEINDNTNEGTTASKFPFVETLPSYGVQATKMLRNSKAFHMQIGIAVDGSQGEEWKAFADANYRKWIGDALEVQRTDPDWQGSNINANNITRCYDIYDAFADPVTEAPPDNGFYSMNWLSFPIIEDSAGCTYNYDFNSRELIAGGIAFMKGTQQCLFGPFTTVGLHKTDPIEAAKFDSFVANFVPPEVDPSEPFNNIGIPIFDSADTVYVNVTEQQNFVGHVALWFQFRSWIEDLLPERSTGVIIVVEQACGNPFTYRVDGSKATYLGAGDLHDTKYDDMVFDQVLAALLNTGETSSYTGIPVSEDFCPSTLKIYPSQDMENNHRSTDPLLLSLMSAAIFIFTSLVFLSYDWIVERRQKIVLDRAVQSGAIVSSLFPQAVAQKLYDENKANTDRDEKQKKLRQSMGPALMVDHLSAPSAQIATLYQDTTIFFADLAGFTKWASKRTPSDVFLLLETLYGAFDEIAMRRKVFKIETIGDCYVAITGCPEPQKNHAVIMVRFAQDCMTRMHAIVHELVDQLGEDTASLGFRVGLHSGATTAGVLRGQKQRFQLFGDTVNTAARMEGNGVPGKIHISEDTANALEASGKGSWLIPRPDKIVAKGKGVLQTYFVKHQGMARAGSVISSMTRSVTASLKDEEIYEAVASC